MFFGLVCSNQIWWLHLMAITVLSLEISVIWFSFMSRFFRSLELSLCHDPRHPIENVSKWIVQSRSTFWILFRCSEYLFIFLSLQFFMFFASSYGTFTSISHSFLVLWSLICRSTLNGLSISSDVSLWLFVSLRHNCSVHASDSQGEHDTVCSSWPRYRACCWFSGFRF